MANPISAELKTGTLGELLVQLRLLQYRVQASPPLKDTGNDLIALKGTVCRTVQVKTTTKNDGPFDLDNMDKDFDILALVNLRGEKSNFFLDKSEIYLVWRTDGFKTYYTMKELEERGFRMTMERVNSLFSSPLNGIISARQVVW